MTKRLSSFLEQHDLFSKVSAHQRKDPVEVVEEKQSLLQRTLSEGYEAVLNKSGQLAAIDMNPEIRNPSARSAKYPEMVDSETEGKKKRPKFLSFWGSEEEESGTKFDRARVMFKELINRPDADRNTIIDEFMMKLDATESTASSYYDRLIKEWKETQGMQQQPQDMEQPPMDDNEMGGIEQQSNSAFGFDMSEQEIEDREGVVRFVKGAHLVYKRKMDNGRFEELWIYNVDKTQVDKEIDIRKEIIAGTDIEPHKTQSADGEQKYEITTLGDAQMVHITGLPN